MLLRRFRYIGQPEWEAGGVIFLRSMFSQKEVREADDAVLLFNSLVLRGYFVYTVSSIILKSPSLERNE